MDGTPESGMRWWPRLVRAAAVYVVLLAPIRLPDRGITIRKREPGRQELS
jgi:hypothetical protein